jgi:hypothetical protein
LDSPKAATTIVNTPLSENPLAEAPVCEASGVGNRDQALLLARKWEAQAREHRASLGQTAGPSILRIRRLASSARSGPLSQQEVGLLLSMSVRRLREFQRRAFAKLRNHPLLRHVWLQFLTGDLGERQPALTSEETEALFQMARTPEERRLMRKILALIGGRHD